MWFWYWVHSAGSAEAGIGDDVGHANMSVSYLTDALSDLLEVVWRSGNGEAEARCSWEDEPGEYRWILTRDGDEVHLRILEFSDRYPSRPDEVGSLLFDTRQPWATLARAIALGASRTLEKYGESEYRERWGKPFPTAMLARLRELLRSGPSEPVQDDLI
jgi:hypothetical protein